MTKTPYTGPKQKRYFGVDTKLNFGKYAKKTIFEVMVEDSGYFRWMLTEMEGSLTFSPEVQSVVGKFTVTGIVALEEIYALIAHESDGKFEDIGKPPAPMVIPEKAASWGSW